MFLATSIALRVAGYSRGAEAVAYCFGLGAFAAYIALCIFAGLLDVWRP